MLTTKYLFIALLCVCNARMYIYIIKMPFAIPLHFVSASFCADKAWWEPDQSSVAFYGEAFCAPQRLVQFFSAGMRVVRRLELEKETQNKPIKWIVCWVFSLISFKLPFKLPFPPSLNTLLFGCFLCVLFAIGFNFRLDIKTCRRMSTGGDREMCRKIFIKHLEKCHNRSHSNEIMCELRHRIDDVMTDEMCDAFEVSETWNNETTKREKKCYVDLRYVAW